MKNVQNIVHKIFRFMAPKATFVMDQEKKTKRLATKSKTKAVRYTCLYSYLRFLYIFTVVVHWNIFILMK